MTTDTSDPHHVCDIIMSIPWHCGDSDCPVGWHLANYWIDTSADTGYTCDHYSDGDHEEVEESEVPDHEEYDRRWREYHQYVADMGEDPLGEFMVTRTFKERQKWTFIIARGIAGLYLRQARRGRGDWTIARDLPMPVAEFMCLTEWGSQFPRIRNKLDVPWKTVQEMAEACKELTMTSEFMGAARFEGVLTIEVPRKESAIQRDLQRAARRALQKRG